MRIHRESRGAFAVVLGLGLVAGLVAYLLGYSPRHAGLVALLLSLGLGLPIALFFRDPKRNIQVDPNQVLAPADGKVVSIKEMHDADHFGDQRIRLSIFLSVTNVHLNRHPVSGKVMRAGYDPGRYLVAFHPKSSTLNERSTIVVRTPGGIDIMFRQIAGFVARRIRTYCQTGDEVMQGEPMGFIKFGSRMDVFLPLESKVVVQKGAKVKAGIDVLAILSTKPDES